MICSSWILHNYNALSWLTLYWWLKLMFVLLQFLKEIWIPLLFTNHVNKTKTNSERRGRYINWHFDQLMALQFKEKEYCQTSFCNHLLQVQMTSPQRPSQITIFETSCKRPLPPIDWDHFKSLKKLYFSFVFNLL